MMWFHPLLKSLKHGFLVGSLTIFTGGWDDHGMMDFTMVSPWFHHGFTEHPAPLEVCTASWAIDLLHPSPTARSQLGGGIPKGCLKGSRAILVH